MSKSSITKPTGFGSLAARQEHANEMDMPQWGRSISAAELITMTLQREGTRNDAMSLLALTLADLGITGEEIAHWQNQPGICHDCNATGRHYDEEWGDKQAQFPTAPFDFGLSYLKKDGPQGRRAK